MPVRGGTRRGRAGVRVIAKPRQVSLRWVMENAPNDEAKARRTVRVLYFCMAVGIALPFLLLWLLR